MSYLPKQFYYKNNRLQQIRGFYYSALLGSLSKAADFMRISQASVSLQIQTLERDLSVKLLERKGPTFSLTTQGELFFTLARTHVEGVDHLLEKFYNADEKSKIRHIRISTNHISLINLLPRYIKLYHDQYPHQELTITNQSFDKALNRLKKDDVDFVIYPAKTVPDTFDFHPIKEYKTVLVVNKDHPLTHINNLTLTDVAKYDLVRIDPHLITVPLFEETIREYNLKTPINLVNSDWEILKALVKAGVGVAILSDICLSDDDPTLVGIPLTEYFPSIKYGVITKKDRQITKEAIQFIQLLVPTFVPDNAPEEKTQAMQTKTPVA